MFLTQILLLFRYVGINASDVNFSAGRYDPSACPPFDAGFEVSNYSQRLKL